MIKVRFRGRPDFQKIAQREVQKIKDQILGELVSALRQMQNAIMQTPVYTGRTLVNYRWTLDAPNASTRSAIKDPELPGTTSEMKIGTEPRRGANAAPVIEEFAQLISELKVSRNPLRNIYLTNNTPYFTDVEYGSYKTSEGHVTRTPPGGMVRKGETALQTLVQGLRVKGGEL